MSEYSLQNGKIAPPESEADNMEGCAVHHLKPSHASSAFCCAIIYLMNPLYLKISVSIFLSL